MSRVLRRVGALVCLLAGLSSASAHAAEAELKDGSQPTSATSVNKPAANSVFLEGMGSGLFYSVNYERRVIDDVGVRAGFSYMSMGAEATAGGSTTSASSTYVTVPITVSY